MKTVYCYYYPDMADFETVLLLHRLHAAGGRRIVAVAQSMEPVVSQSGLRYLPDLTIAQASADDAEALIIPGGPINNRQNEILPLIQEMDKQHKLIAAICFGPQFLARAGVLSDRAFTTSCTPEHIAALSTEDPFPREGWQMQRVVQDGHIITAQGHAFVDFAMAVCRYLNVYRDEQQLRQELGRIKEND